MRREPHHLFLKHDSFLEVGEPLELDDYIIEESLRRSGIIGSVSRELCAGIIKHLAGARYLREADKNTIRGILGAL